jgi:hypothetical protein
VRRQGAREGGRGVIAAPDGLRNDLRYRFRVFPGLDEVGGDSPGPRDRKPVHVRPLAVTDRAHVNPDVRAAGLVTAGHGELVLVRRKMT